MAGDLRAHVLLNDQRGFQDFGGAIVLSSAGRLHLTYSKIQKLPYPSAENHFPEPHEFLEERLDIY